MLLPIALAVLWLAFTGAQARAQLSDASGELPALRSALAAGDLVRARHLLSDVQRRAASAEAGTHDLVWAAAARVPFLGAPAATVRGLTSAVDRLAAEALPDVVTAAGALDPSRIRSGPDRIDLSAVQRAQRPLGDADARVADIRRDVDALPRRTWMTLADDARRALATQLEATSESLRSADTLARLLPPMLGADGPRRYFLAFQTNAEARGTGGLVGAFGIVVADHGRLRVELLGDNTRMNAFSPPVVDLGADFNDRYASYASAGLLQNSNISAHFPYAARIWEEMWARQTGQQLDGAIATDPTALSYLLGAMGPTTLPGGELVTAANVVPLTESEAYTRYARDNSARKAFLIVVARAVLDQLLGRGAGSPRGVLDALARAAGERRLLVSSRHEAEQALLAETPVAGTVLVTAAPYAFVVANNAGGNKLDYYLGREVTYTAGPCGHPRRSSEVVVRLSSSAPPGGRGLPDYVAGRLDGRAGRGTNHVLVSLYATSGAQLTGAVADGRPILVAAQKELGHPVYTADVEVAPQGTTTVTFRLDEPTSAGSAVVPLQPLVRPVTAHSAVPVCGVVP